MVVAQPTGAVLLVLLLMVRAGCPLIHLLLWRNSILALIIGMTSIVSAASSQEIISALLLGVLRARRPGRGGLKLENIGRGRWSRAAALIHRIVLTCLWPVMPQWPADKRGRHSCFL